MAVIGERQPKMTLRLRQIARLFHRAQRLVGEDLFRGRSLGLFEKRGKIGRGRVLLMQDLRRDPQKLRQPDQFSHPFLLWLFMHAVHKRQSLFPRKRRGGAVGGDHQLLDHLLRFAVRPRLRVHTHAPRIEGEFRFSGFKIDFPIAHGTFFQQGRKLPRGAQ